MRPNRFIQTVSKEVKKTPQQFYRHNYGVVDRKCDCIPIVVLKLIDGGTSSVTSGPIFDGGIPSATTGTIYAGGFP